MHGGMVALLVDVSWDRWIGLNTEQATDSMEGRDNFDVSMYHFPQQRRRLVLAISRREPQSERHLSQTGSCGHYDQD